MSKWNSPAEWQRLCDGSACPICIRGQPLDIIVTLDASWLTMSESAPMVGYVCLVSRVHAVDLRYAGDPFEGRAIEPFRITQPVYGHGQFAGLRGRLVQGLGTSAA